MYQIATPILNRLHQEGTVTPLMAKVGPLTRQEAVNKALDAEVDRLVAAGEDEAVALSLIQAGTLYLERQAIQRLTAKDRTLATALPQVNSPREAALMAATDRTLTRSQMTRLIELLRPST